MNWVITHVRDVDVVEKKLARMLQNNPALMDCYERYQEIIADYNREKDRATVEQTRLVLMLVQYHSRTLRENSVVTL